MASRTNPKSKKSLISVGSASGLALQKLLGGVLFASFTLQIIRLITLLITVIIDKVMVQVLADLGCNGDRSFMRVQFEAILHITPIYFHPHTARRLDLSLSARAATPDRGYLLLSRAVGDTVARVQERTDPSVSHWYGIDCDSRQFLCRSLSKY